MRLTPLTTKTQAITVAVRPRWGPRVVVFLVRISLIGSVLHKAPPTKNKGRRRGG